MKGKGEIMKKYAVLFLVMALSGAYAAPAAAIDTNDISLIKLDTDSRSAKSGGSIMLKRNADQYRQLSNEEKAEIERRRRAEAEYRRMQEEQMRRQAQREAMRRAQEEAERQRAAALKPITLYGNKLKIYALVNGEVITSNDMQSRINAFIMTTGIPYNAKTKDMIIDRVLQAAIDEKLKVQEAVKNNIKVSPKEVENAVREFEKMNKLSTGQLQKIFAESKVSMKNWLNQVEADLAWTKLVQKKGYSQVKVSENEVKRALDGIRKDAQVQRFMVSEIVINRKDAKNINKLVQTLREDPRFEIYARQFSQSASSANGGQLGWVTKGKLSAQLEKTILNLKEGKVSNAVLYGNDYYIFKLEKIYNPKSDAKSLPSSKEVRRFLENKKLEEFASKYIKDLRNRALIEKKI